MDDYGHTLGGVRATGPADMPPAVPGRDAAELEYPLHLFTSADITVRLTMAPSLNALPDRPVRIAVAVDDDAPQIVTLMPAGYRAENGNRDWEESVRNNARFVTTTHRVAAAGAHTLRVWMIDPGVVLQKILVTTAAAPRQTTYLGPPESYRGK